MKNISLIMSSLALVCVAAGCASDEAVRKPAWNRPSPPPFAVTDTWPYEDWQDVYRPGEFIRIKPSVQPVADGVLAIRWKTAALAKSWAEVSQDGGATWRECWQSVDGQKKEYGVDFAATVRDYDMTKPLRYRVVARQIENVDTWGHHSFYGEEWLAGEFTGGYYPVRNYRAQVAARREKFTGDEYVEEGDLKAVDPENFDIVMFNDIHHSVGYYPELMKRIGDRTAMVVFGGDICDHARSREDFEKFLEAPMAYVSKHGRCAVAYLRGNHETWGLHAAYIRDHVALHRIDDGEALFGAYSIGKTRMAFLDTANDETSVYNPKLDRDIDWDYETYLADEAAWLDRETASDAWKNAANRLAFAHIPVFSAGNTNSVLGRTLFPVLAKSGLSLFVGGHWHNAKLLAAKSPYGKDPDFTMPYDVAIGGGPTAKDPAKTYKSVGWPTAIIVSVRDGKASVTCIDMYGDRVF